MVQSHRARMVEPEMRIIEQCRHDLRRRVQTQGEELVARHVARGVLPLTDFHLPKAHLVDAAVVHLVYRRRLAVPRREGRHRAGVAVFGARRVQIVAGGRALRHRVAPPGLDTER